jgi:hypothetical protein
MKQIIVTLILTVFVAATVVPMLIGKSNPDSMINLQDSVYEKLSETDNNQP